MTLSDPSLGVTGPETLGRPILNGRGTVWNSGTEMAIAASHEAGAAAGVSLGRRTFVPLS